MLGDTHGEGLVQREKGESGQLQQVKQNLLLILCNVPSTVHIIIISGKTSEHIFTLHTDITVGRSEGWLSSQQSMVYALVPFSITREEPWCISTLMGQCC